MATEHACKGGVVLYETMTEPEYATSCEPDKSPFMYALKKTGFKGDISEWIRQDVCHLLLTVFNCSTVCLLCDICRLKDMQ